MTQNVLLAIALTVICGFPVWMLLIWFWKKRGRKGAEVTGPVFPVDWLGGAKPHWGDGEFRGDHEGSSCIGEDGQSRREKWWDE